MIELLLGFVIFITYQYHRREIIVDVPDYKAGYFVLFYSNEGLTDNKMERGFLFDRKVKPSRNSVFLSPQVKDKYMVKLNYPYSWANTGIGSHTRNFENFENLEFFSVIPLTDAQED